MPARARQPSQPPPQKGLAFLLSQVGAHVAARFGECVAPLGLKPYHAGILSTLQNRPGITQQALSDLLGIFPSRLVALLDDLTKLKLIERRTIPSDRRTYALHLTKTGTSMWAKVGKEAARMQEEVCAALNATEQEQLAGLLARIASQQGITPDVHPGYRKLGRTCGEDESLK
jgi:DNA-binding MarR family transcriptional regulator